ncbi:MAG: PD-(D/E)XK nuclease-like domain-containing protein, partial [Chloroflexi bacterium]|nr:PD-(D/E)XK nuclease-like domain-containing protein [Chloroflexota bacterium]
ESMILGSALHTALLEPEAFDERFAVSPKFDRRTKQGKEDAQAWEAANAGKVALREEHALAVRAMVRKVQSHSFAASLIERGHAERSLFFLHEPTGIECKIRPDFLSMNGAGEICAIVDVKTANHAGIEEFSRATAGYGYDVQAALYSDAISSVLGRQVPFFFLVIENAAPYSVALYKASNALLEAGRKRYRAALEMLSWCRQTDCWPGYQTGDGYEELDLPVWMKRAIDEIEV